MFNIHLEVTRLRLVPHTSELPWVLSITYWLESLSDENSIDILKYPSDRVQDVKGKYEKASSVFKRSSYLKP